VSQDVQGQIPGRFGFAPGFVAHEFPDRPVPGACNDVGHRRASQRNHVTPGPGVNGCDHASNDGAKADAKGAYFCGLGFFMLRDPVQGF